MGLAAGQSMTTEPKSTLSESDPINDRNGDWGVTIFTDADEFSASVSYVAQASVIRGRTAMAEAFKDAIFIATSES